MLTRLKLRKDLRIVVRFLSEKPPENDGKNPAEEIQHKQKSEDDASADTQKINSLLKSMIENYNKPKSENNFAAKPVRMSKNVNDFTTEKIEENLTEAAEEVAKAMGGNVKQTESELLSKVLGKINQTPTDLSELLVGMKVNRSSKDHDDGLNFESRGEQVKRMVNRVRTTKRDQSYRERQPQTFNDERRTAQLSTIDVFSGIPSGIFSKVQPGNYGTKLDTWEELEKRELAMATAQPPANYFQKMILWTNQGKIWKFPINNEQGLEEEEKVHFSEHVFVDAYLEGWCPTKGPVRHFMELVCTGLSKNSFYTAQEKKDHIMWYKEYFESKKDLLTEIGVWIVENKTDEATT